MYFTGNAKAKSKVVQEQEVESRMLRHSHSPSVVSWTCVLHFHVLRCGLCARSPPGCHFSQTRLLSDLAETDDACISISWINTNLYLLTLVFPPAQFAALQNLAKIPGFGLWEFPHFSKTIQSIINHLFPANTRLSFPAYICNLTQPFHVGSFCLGQCWWYCHITKSYFLS